MPSFLVESSGADGRGIETAEFEAADAATAARLLAARGRIPLSVRPAGSPSARWAWLARHLHGHARLSHAAMALFAEQLADLLRAGLALDQALALLTPKCWRRSKFDPPCRLNFDPGLGAGIG